MLTNSYPKGIKDLAIVDILYIVIIINTLIIKKLNIRDMTYDDFTVPAQDLILFAQSYAKERNNEEVTIAHFIKALFTKNFGYILDDFSIEDFHSLKVSANHLMPAFSSDENKRQVLSNRMNKILSKAKKRAKERANTSLVNEYGIVFEILKTENLISQLLISYGVSLAVIQKLSNKCESQYKEVYIDDLVVYSKDFEKHLLNARKFTVDTKNSKLSIKILALQILKKEQKQHFLHKYFEKRGSVMTEIGEMIFDKLPKGNRDGIDIDDVEYNDDLKILLKKSKELAYELDMKEVTLEVFMATLLKHNTEIGKIFKKFHMRVIDCLRAIPIETETR